MRFNSQIDLSSIDGLFCQQLFDTMCAPDQLNDGMGSLCHNQQEMELAILYKGKTCAFISILRSKFQQGLCSKMNMLLSPANKTGIGFLRQSFGTQAQAQITRTSRLELANSSAGVRKKFQ